MKRGFLGGVASIRLGLPTTKTLSTYSAQSHQVNAGVPTGVHPKEICIPMRLMVDRAVPSAV